MAPRHHHGSVCFNAKGLYGLGRNLTPALPRQALGEIDFQE